MHTYTNPKTQEYVNGVQADIDAREARLVSLRRAVSQQKGGYKKLEFTTVKISSLTAEEQSKVIRFGK